MTKEIKEKSMGPYLTVQQSDSYFTLYTFNYLSFLVVNIFSVSLFLGNLVRNTRLLVVPVVTLNCAHSLVDVVRAGAWLVSFLDFSVLFCARERHVRASIRLVDVVVT